MRAISDTAIAIVQLGHSPRIALSRHLEQIERVISHGADYRRSGAASTGLLNVAAGRSDVFYEKHLNLWDAAAGLLLISEAGGKCLHSGLADFARQGSEVLALGASANSYGIAWNEVLGRD